MEDKRHQRPAKVKNKTPAEIQITAEQILKEAHDRAEPISLLPKQKITDAEELNDYRFHKRKQFEDAIRRNRHHISHWLKYAAWEESQKEYHRARSVYERVLEIDGRNPAIWTRYAEMEMRNKNINLARNLWDRACTQLPRVDQFWYKYAYMEEVLGNITGARQIFERWMEWRPPKQAWESYIAFELRYKEVNRAREIYQRFVTCHPDADHWIQFAKFEETQQCYDQCRDVYEKAIETLGDQYVTIKLLHSFAKFEMRQKQPDRARAIYQYALTHLPKSESEQMYQHYIHFEKQFGSQTRIEKVVAEKRRYLYDQEVKVNPYNYDVWFDLIRLEESMGDIERIRDTYEKAVAQVPPTEEKRVWRRYIYLWLHYALFEETITSNFDRARQVFEQCLKLIPHSKFTFGKVWLYFAEFLIRRFELNEARKKLGYALGMCPKKKLFKGYIELELKLLEFDRVRILYERYLHFLPENCYAWYKYAEMEKMLGDIDRCRAIFELAIQQPVLDVPEVLWKAFIDFEIEQEEWDRVRNLYERLLQRTTHYKVWMSYAKLELQAQDTSDVSVRTTKARAVFERGYKALKERNANEERVLLLEAWREFEQDMGTEDDVTKVQLMFPKLVKKRRLPTDTSVPSLTTTVTSMNVNLGEEYYDYIFPDDVTQRPSLKLLSLAQKWKEQQQLQKQQQNQEEEEKEEEEEEEEGKKEENLSPLHSDQDVEMELEQNNQDEIEDKGSKEQKDKEDEEEDDKKEKDIENEGEKDSSNEDKSEENVNKDDSSD